MSKLTDDLREYLKVYNPHNFARCGGEKIYVTYSPQMLGRANKSADYRVVGIDFKADPNAPWYNYGDKVFTLFSSSKNEARDKALSWATKTFGIKEWAKMPFRESWVSKDAYDRVMVLLKEAKRSRDEA